jgi:methionine-rich copper-binding protein CopC
MVLPSPRKVQPQKPISMSNKVYIVIIALLLGVVGFMAVKINNQDKEYVYISQEYASLDEDRKELAADLEAMKLNYDTLSVENSDMQAKIDEQENELAILLKKVKNKDYDISKLRAEAETLRGIMKNYIHQIDSLNQLNQQLTMERDNESMRANQAEAKGKELESELSTSKEMNAKGSILSTGEFSNLALFERNNGKQVDTDRASKTEMIKSCFKIRKNQIAKPGVRTLYMSVVGPDGKVLTGKSSGTVGVGGADTPYSVTREVDYQQNDTDVCVYYTANEGYEFQKGNYKVLIYESGNQIGSSTFVLK